MKLNRLNRTAVTVFSAATLVTGFVMLSPESARATNRFVDQIAL